jgi:hypothetical protein
LADTGIEQAVAFCKGKKRLVIMYHVATYKKGSRRWASSAGSWLILSRLWHSAKVKSA